MSFQPGAPVSDLNPYPVSPISPVRGFRPGDPIGDANPLPVTGMSSAQFLENLSARNLTRPTNNKIAVFGPSHAANHFFSTDPTGLPPQAQGSIIGPVNWANALSGGRALLDTSGAYGYNGDRTIQEGVWPGMLSRLDGVIASGCGHIVMVAPTANDRNAMSAQQSITALTTMIEKISKAGIFLTILPDFPHGTAASTGNTLANTAANPQLDNWQVVNRWLLGLSGRGGVTVIDTAQILVDPTSGFGRAAVDTLYDGLHMTAYGAYLVGRVLARQWRLLYPPVSGLPMGSSDRVYQAGINKASFISSQPYFGGTAGVLQNNATGTVANDWTATGATDGLSAAYSKVSTTAFAGRTYADDGDGPISKDWQQIAITGNATASNEIVVLRQAVPCTIGEMLRACSEIEIDAATTNLAGVTLYVYHNTSNTIVRQFQVPTVTSPFALPAVALALVLNTPEWKADSAQLQLQLAIRPVSGRAINATIRVRGFGVRRTGNQPPA